MKKPQDFDQAKYFRKDDSGIVILVEHEGDNRFEVDVLDTNTNEVAENPLTIHIDNGLARVRADILEEYGIDIDENDNPSLHQLFVDAEYF